jgi:hypothetical protein
MKFTKLLLLSLAMVFTTSAFAAPAAFRVCDKKPELDSFHQLVTGCSHTLPSKGSNTHRNKIDIEWKDTNNGNLVLRTVNSTITVICKSNRICAVEDSDTIVTGAIMGHAPEGRYMLDYGYYIGVDVYNNPTEYLVNTGPAFGGDPAGVHTGTADEVGLGTYDVNEGQ